MNPDWKWALDHPVTATLVEASPLTDHMIVMVVGPNPGQAITLTNRDEGLPLVNGVQVEMTNGEEGILWNIMSAASERNGVPIKIPPFSVRADITTDELRQILSEEYGGASIPQACIMEGTGIYYEISRVSPMFNEDGTVTPIIELGKCICA